MRKQEPRRGAPPALEVESHRSGIVIISLRGEHDLSGKAALTAAMTAARERRKLLVDLSECTFIDSSIIGVLILDLKQRTASGARIELVIPPEASTVNRVATIAGLSAFLRIHETRAAALAGFEAGEHEITLRDRRLSFGDPEAYAAHCSCGWTGETHTGRAGERAARRDGAQHVEHER